MAALSHYWIFSDAAPHRRDESALGGKACNLFRLQRFGFRVPPWCVLTTSVCREALRDQKKTMEQILSSGDLTGQASLEAASLQLSEIVSAADLPDAQDLLAALAQKLGRDSLLAVRSSVVGEDSEQHSFAGQMDSFLNVPLDRVPEMVKRVWASAFSVRALSYRRRKHLSLSDISTAVIIQKMVQPVASGVLFSRAHTNSPDQCVISAGFGLGEGVVLDTVETDTYRIGWHSDEPVKEVAVKESRVVLDATRHSGTRKEAVSTPLRAQAVLTDAQIRRLRDLGVRAERCFGGPQDIEWSFDGAGDLFVLQARPIVPGKHTAASAPVRIWDNSNIVESYPDLTLPLTFSFARAAYETTFRNTALSFLLFKKQAKQSRIFNNMIGLLDGRIYYNLLNWYEMLSYLPGFKQRKHSWDQMIGIMQAVEFPRSHLSLINRAYSLLAVCRTLLTIRRTAQRFFIDFHAVYERYGDADFSAASEHEQMAVYDSLTQEVGDLWHLTLHNDLCAMTYYEWLKKLSCAWGLSSRPNLHNDLLCAASGVESVAPLRSLAHVVDMVRNDARYRSLFDGDDRAVWATICSDSTYALLRETLETHLKEFGDRCLEELKLDKPSFREKPELLVHLIREQVRLDLTDRAAEKNEQQIRSQAETFVRQNLRHPLKRLLFWFVLTNARDAIVNRENMRFARSRLFGILRRLFRRMGELFAARGLLECGHDIHYLTVDEVFGFIQGSAVTRSLKALVGLRKQEYADYAKRAPQERVRTMGIPYLCSFDGEHLPGKGAPLTGIGCSSGTARGTARVISEPREPIGAGEHILIARSTDPGWLFLMTQSKGIIVEKGSVLSHTAIIGRELGIPTIVGVKDATQRIPDGTSLFMDGGTGEIRCT